MVAGKLDYVNPEYFTEGEVDDFLIHRDEDNEDNDFEEIIKKPTISINIPTYNRRHFLPLIVNNLERQTYPRNLLEVVIDDDGNIPLMTDKILEEVKERLSPMKINYIYNFRKDFRSTLGAKRNRMVDISKGDIIVNMDDDELYLDDYIKYSYRTLKETNSGCVGSNQLIITYPYKDFEIRGFNCGEDKTKIHENSLMFTKEWFKASKKYGDTTLAEGRQLLTDYTDKVYMTEIHKCLIQIAHRHNTADKEMFFTDQFKMQFELSGDIKNCLRNLFSLMNVK
tara:strand:- start:4148 stop:4993 length:846 start_codon:yes stop_codon:yes gene_type:complete